MMTVHEYVETYEFRGDTDYTPNDHEKTLIEDAIAGYLAYEAAKPASDASDKESAIHEAFRLGLDEAADYIERIGSYGYEGQAASIRSIDMPASLASLATPPAPATVEMREAARDVLAERRRQVEAEGWTPEHDDEHDKGEMVAAAISYANRHNRYVPPPEPVRFQAIADAATQARKELVTLREWAKQRAAENADKPPRSWPWDASWWKPKDRRSDLVRAAALLVAEIERLDRAALAVPATDASDEQPFPPVDHLVLTAHGAVTMLDDWTNHNETQFTGWGEGEVPPAAEFMRVKSGQALKAITEIVLLRAKTLAKR